MEIDMNWIKNILGITDLERQIAMLETEIEDLTEKVSAALDHYETQGLALGRIIAKLDPNYGRDPISDRDLIAESDAIGNEVIKRLRAEQQAIDNQRGPK
jgi:uncharacterized small protein (DUF1192 family)